MWIVSKGIELFSGGNAIRLDPWLSRKLCHFVLAPVRKSET